MSRSTAEAVAGAYRAEWAQVLATVIRLTRDIDLAEDCVQDAFAQALHSWARDGVPERPGAWLTTVAGRAALQHRRRAAIADRHRGELIGPPGSEPIDTGTVFATQPDDRLRLIFTCCHPALSAEARVALTLRLVCGLSSGEVAGAFLVKPATMQARITRAKKRIAETGLRYRIPRPDELPDRLDSVCDTVQLVYNAGHVAGDGPELVRVDLADRALELARLLAELLPREGEPAALLALLLLTDARRDARVDAAGALVPLDEQDRRLWNQAAISDGLAMLHQALADGARGRYAVMACIAAVHAEAVSAPATDWNQIVKLYQVLERTWPTPVVALNRAIAIGAAAGPVAGLAALAELSDRPELRSYHYLPAARAEFFRRLGRWPEAARAYADALDTVSNQVEAAYLRRRLAEVTGASALRPGFIPG